jgi:hypothetical protein
MPFGDTDTQTAPLNTLPTVGGAPAPIAAGGPSAGGGLGANIDAQKAQLNQMVQQMLQRATQGKMGLPQPVQRNSPESMQQQPFNMNTAWSKKGDWGIALQNMGTTVHNLVAQHKQNQTRDALADWQGFDQAIEKAQMAAGPGDPSDPAWSKKVSDNLAQMPWVKAMLDPSNPKSVKRLKNMYKALNVDLTDDKENVYGQALKQLHKVKGAEKELRNNQAKKQEFEQKRQQTMKARMANLMSQARMAPPDPKNLESAARILESQLTHEESLAARTQAHLDSLEVQRGNLQARQQQIEQSHRDRQERMEDMQTNFQESLQIRKQLAQIAADKAYSLHDTSGLKDAVEKGFPINMIGDKESRDAVIKSFTKEGRSVPKPISPAEQASLDDGEVQLQKTHFWKDALKNEYADSQGNLPNKPFGSTWQRLQYKFGKAPPDAEIISDFSRERYAAVTGLIKGMRRGDIIKDMIQHTPDPVKDSPRLMYLKLDALDANYSLARAVTLQEHGFDKDPVDGSSLKDNIQSYENHLKSANTDINNLNKQQAAPDKKVYSKGQVPD